MRELEYLLQADCQCTFCWITLDLTSHSALVLHHPLLYLLSNIKAYYMQVLRGIGETIASRSIPKVSNYAKTRLGINFPCLVTMMFWYHSSWVECALLVIYKSICKCNLSNWCLARKMLWSGKLKCTLYIKWFIDLFTIQWLFDKWSKCPKLAELIGIFCS